MVREAQSARRQYECTCQACGKLFFVPDPGQQRSRRYCSIACYAATRWRSEENLRNRAVYELRASGSTLGDIAKQYGISKERVRQICNQEERRIQRESAPTIDRPVSLV